MNKASGGDGIPAELFQILKDDAVKVLHSEVATGLGKVSFHSNPIERQCQRLFKLPENCSHLTHQQSSAENSPSQQQYMNQELRCQTRFRKGRGTGDKIVNICWIIEKAREFQENIYSWFIDYAKAFDCVDHNKLQKILKEMGIPGHWTSLLRILYAGQ